MKEIIIEMFSDFKGDKKAILYGFLVGIGFIGFIYFLAIIQYVFFY
jgi:hypothetical protein